MIKLEGKLIMATSVRQLSLSFCGAFFVEFPCISAFGRHYSRSRSLQAYVLMPAYW